VSHDFFLQNSYCTDDGCAGIDSGEVACSLDSWEREWVAKKSFGGAVDFLVRLNLYADSCREAIGMEVSFSSRARVFVDYLDQQHFGWQVQIDRIRGL